MKKALKIVFIIVLIPVVLFIGAISFLKFADLNKYKPEVEQLVNKYAGIDIKINGDLDVGVSLRPSIKLSNVDVSEPGKDVKMAHIGNATMQFSVLPLLKKEIVVDLIETQNTDIFAGEKNSVQINHLAISMDDYESPINIDLDTNAAGIDISGNAVLSSLKNIKESKYNATDLKTDINTMGYSVIFDGNIEGLQDKIQLNGDYKINRKGTDLGGKISFDMQNEIPYLNIKAQSEKIEIKDFTEKKHAAGSWLISEAYAEEYIPNTEIPYEYLQMFDADVTIDVKKIVVDTNIVLENVKADANLKNGVLKANLTNMDFQKNIINGRLEVSSPKTKPYLRLNIKGDGFDINKLQSNFNSKKKAELKFDWLISNAYASELISNTVIPYQYFDMVDADIESNLKMVRINDDIQLNDVNISANLKNSVLNANIKNITAGNGKIAGNIKINGTQKTLAVNLVGKGIILQKFYKAFANAGNKELYIKEGGKTTLDINVNTSGKDTNQYLSNLNGKIIGFTDKSVLQIKSLDKLKGNILVQILNAVKIPVTNSDLNLSCAVIRGDISSGLVKFPKGIAIDAKDFYLVADGKINLQNDKINLNLQPFSGKITDVNISSILGNLIKITGTISKPTIGINQTETAKNVIGAIASGGVYNVGDLMLSADGAPCHTALSGTEYANYFKADKSIGGTVSKGYSNTKDTIKDLGKGINNQVKDIKKQIKGIFN